MSKFLHVDADEDDEGANAIPLCFRRYRPDYKEILLQIFLYSFFLAMLNIKEKDHQHFLLRPISLGLVFRISVYTNIFLFVCGEHKESLSNPILKTYQVYYGMREKSLAQRNSRWQLTRFESMPY